MRIGTACGTNDVELIPFLRHLKNKGMIDYVELYARTDATFIDLQKWIDSDLVGTIHAPHDERAGFLNNFLIYGHKIASHIGEYAPIAPLRIIVDAGCVGDEDVFKIASKQVFVENMPYISKTGELFKGVYPSEFANVNLCLDLAHAWIAATHLQERPKSFIRDFLNLKPKHIHFTDSSLAWTDDHSALGIGVVDLKWCLRHIEPDAWLTLETDHQIPNRIDAMLGDIEELNSLLGK